MSIFGIDDLLGVWRYRLFVAESAQPVLEFLCRRSVFVRRRAVALF